MNSLPKKIPARTSMLCSSAMSMLESQPSAVTSCTRREWWISEPSRSLSAKLNCVIARAGSLLILWTLTTKSEQRSFFFPLLNVGHHGGSGSCVLRDGAQAFHRTGRSWTQKLCAEHDRRRHPSRRWRAGDLRSEGRVRVGIRAVGPDARACASGEDSGRETPASGGEQDGRRDGEVVGASI